MIRFVGLLLITMLSTQAATAADRLKVVTTFTVIQDMAARIAGEAADVVSITKPGADIHTYQPTPRDLIRAQGAGLIIWNGLGLELWFEKFYHHLTDVPTVEASHGVEALPIISGAYEGKPNPHAWISPRRARIYVENIRAALTQYDPGNADTYQSNAESYLAEIDSVVAPLREQLDALPEARRWLASSEGAFSYLADDFSLRELYLWPINADQQGTPQQVRRMIDTIRAEKVPVIFSESTVSPTPAKQVAEETAIRYGGVLYVDSLSKAGGPVPTYLDMLRVTLGTLVRELGK